MHIKYAFFFLFVGLFTGSDGAYKRWLPNTNLNNPANWDQGRLPCGNDRMIIPDDSPVVFLQMNTTLQELVLPKDGELVLGAFSVLAFTNEADHSAECLGSGADIHFNASRPQDWTDPINWCQTESEKSDCQTVDLLDSEKIPCSTDHVIFPTGSSYYVNLGTNLDITVNTLKVSGKAYSTSTFETFLTTDNGKNIFPPSSGLRSRMTIRRELCKDASGCVCGNDQGPIFQALCSNQRNRCTPLRCTAPIRANGSCCDACGAVLLITYGAGFQIGNLKTDLKRQFLDGKDDYSNVAYIVSKMSDGKIQIVLSDTDGVKSTEVAKQMMDAIQNDISNGGFKYKIIKIEMQGTASSGGSHAAHTGNESEDSSMSTGAIAGIGIGAGVGAVVLLVAAMFAFKRRTSRLEDDLGFKVFDRFAIRQKRKPQVSVPPSVGFNWSSPENVGVTQGFDNPMYGSAPLENIKEMNLELAPTNFGSRSQVEEVQPYNDRGFDNPLYDTDFQGESYFSDPTKVEGGDDEKTTSKKDNDDSTDA